MTPLSLVCYYEKWPNPVGWLNQHGLDDPQKFTKGKSLQNT